jgi:hypothetical protein
MTSAGAVKVGEAAEVLLSAIQRARRHERLAAFTEDEQDAATSLFLNDATLEQLLLGSDDVPHRIRVVRHLLDGLSELYVHLTLARDLGLQTHDGSLERRHPLALALERLTLLGDCRFERRDLLSLCRRRGVDRPETCLGLGKLRLHLAHVRDQLADGRWR